MRARIYQYLKIGFILIMAISLLAGRPTLAAPLRASVTIDLCAKEGSVTMPNGAVIPIWGYALKPSGVPCSDASVIARLPGPLLVVNAGDQVTVNLYNALTQNTSLLFIGQNLSPDMVGAALGSSRTYVFIAIKPWIYLYESGVNAERQVPMGLYGAMIVRPTIAGRAYDSPASTYNVEAVLVLSEIDPLLNANPNGFNLVYYNPKYWLINGEAYPQTDTIAVPFSGQRLLLRYVNAGSIHHTMSLLGLHQRLIARDAFALPYPFDVVAETIPAGQTADAIVTIPSAVSGGSRFPLYNRQLRLTNVASFPGGMMTFIEVQATGPTNQPPVVNAGPDQTVTFPASVNLSGTVSDDGLIAPVSITWSKVSGPGTVTFSNPTALNTTASFSTPGIYVLRLSAFDGENTASDDLIVTVNPPPMHIGDLDGQSTNIGGNRWRATVTITVHDANENPVANATVSGTWSAGDTNGRTLSCVTQSNGSCSVQSGRIMRTTATVTFTVTNATHSSFLYQASANHDPDGDSNGSSITVNRPTLGPVSGGWLIFLPSVTR